MNADLLFALKDVMTACSGKKKVPPFLELGVHSDVLQTELSLAQAVVPYRGSSYVLASFADSITGNFGTPLQSTKFGKVYPYRRVVTQALIERLCPDDLPPPPWIPILDPQPMLHGQEASLPAMRQISEWVVDHARTLQVGSLLLAGGAAVTGLILGGISLPALVIGAGVTALGLAS